MTEHDTDHLDPTADALPEPDRQYTVEEVLDMARLVERIATVCLRADLQAEYDMLLAELSTLVTPAGELLDTAEAAAGEVSATGRVEQISARMGEIRVEMAKKMWRIRFRAMDSDSFASFMKRHKPKDPKANLTDFYSRLVCETAIEPTISADQLAMLRKKLGPTAIGELVKTSWEACTEGGLDVPKLPTSLRLFVEEHSAI